MFSRLFSLNTNFSDMYCIYMYIQPVCLDPINVKKKTVGGGGHVNLSMQYMLLIILYLAVIGSM